MQTRKDKHQGSSDDLKQLLNLFPTSLKCYSLLSDILIAHIQRNSHPLSFCHTSACAEYQYFKSLAANPDKETAGFDLKQGMGKAREYRRALRQGNDQEPLKLLRSKGMTSTHFQAMQRASHLQLKRENFHLSALDINHSLIAVFLFMPEKRVGKKHFGCFLCTTQNGKKHFGYVFCVQHRKLHKIADPRIGFSFPEYFTIYKNI